MVLHPARAAATAEAIPAAPAPMTAMSKDEIMG